MPQTRYIRWVPEPNTIKWIGRIHTFLYKASFGLVGTRVDGLSVLLLTTTGNKSGRARCVALPYFRCSAGLTLVASFGGNPKNPAWFANLLADPNARVQLGTRQWATRVRIPAERERSQLWAEITEAFPRYLNYQQKTTRTIPLVVVEAPPGLQL